MKSTLSAFIMLPLIIISLSFEQALASSKNGVDDGDLWGNSVSEFIDLTISGQSGMSITIEHSFGNIDVRPGTSNQITISGEKRVSGKDNGIAKEFLREMELKIDESPSRLIIKTYYPDDKKYEKKVKNYSISYTIEIPSNVKLDIKNSFGNLDLDNLSGIFIITNSYGEIKALRLNGDTQLSNKFGLITSENITGEAQINSQHGSINIKNVAGNLSAKTSFGPIDVFDIKGDARILNSHGKITVESIGGKAELETSFSTITCSDIDGKTVIRNSHGQVNASNIRSNTSVRTSFNKVKAEFIYGDLIVENEHGTITTSDIRGDIKANTSFAPVHISHIDGGVIVTNQHGDISIDNILYEVSGQDLNNDETFRKRQVNLKTDFGTVRLKLPETLSASINVSATYGKISGDFPLNINLQGLDLSKTSHPKISGSVRDGKDSIDIDVSHGSVYIDQM